MNFVKTSPVGIDIPIRKLQTRIYNVLCDWGDIDGYGRVYRNPKKDRVIPEFYKGDGDYQEVLINDCRDSIFFFDMHPETDVSNRDYATTRLDIIFYVNLKNLIGLTDRQDEEVRNRVIQILKSKPYNYRMEKMYTTIDKVYSEFKGVAEILKNKDMSYYHHFRISGLISYRASNCTSKKLENC